MTWNKPLRNKQVSIFLTMVISFFSIMVTAQSVLPSNTYVQNINDEMQAIHQQLLNKNNSYEDLTQIMHSINLLQDQINECVKKGHDQLKKINPLLNESKKSKAIIQDVPAYDYLLNEEKKSLAQVESCNFLNYKMEDILALATNKIDSVSKLKILKKAPIWDTLSRTSLATIHPSVELAYQHSGIDKLNKKQWLGLVLTLLFGVMLAHILKITNKQTNAVSIINKQHISFMLPLSLICLYLNLSLLHTGPMPVIILIVNALALYAIALFIIRIYFIVGMTRKPSQNILSVFQFLLAVVVNGYVILIQMLFLKNAPIALSFVDYIHTAYLIVALRLVIGCVSGLKPWFTEELVITIQQRIYFLATTVLLGYIAYIVFQALAYPPEFFALLDALYFTLLNIAYIWLIWPLVKHGITQPYRRYVAFILKVVCLSSIIAAWCGYHYLAKALIPNLFVSAIIIRLIVEVNQVFSRIYYLLTDPNQIWSQKLHYFLGLKTHDKLIELYIMRLVFPVPAIMLGTFSIMEIWGGTRYQVLGLFTQLHDGFSILGATIRPALILRAGTIFCLILLLGRALSTYIIRQKMVNEEKHTQSMMFALVRYISFIIGILASLYIAGVNLRNLVVVAGALSVGLGFGLQSFARDFISGLIIMINKPIKIGDHIEVGDRNRNEGFIKKIGALSTQLHTLNHSDVIIPNSEIITKVITNFTFHSNLLSRIHITVKLNKDSDVNQAKQILLDIATTNSHVIQEPPYQPIVLFELFDLNLWCVINDVNKKEIILSDLNLKIAQDLKHLLANED